MNLKKLLKGLAMVSCEGTLDKEISNIKYDSRQCRENSMFIAIKGYDTDGHKYISEAVNNGATAIVCEYEPLNKESNITYIRVRNTRTAMAYLANVFYDDPSKKLNLIGVTGTNGKTSVTFLIKEIFKQWNKEMGVIGTIGNYLGNTFNKSNNTTPESVDLQHMLSQMVDMGIEYAAMEVSSHSLDLKRVEGTRYTMGVFTNLSQDHLDFHENFDNYFQAKAKLFSMTTHGNIINGDDPYGRKIAKDTMGRKVDVYTYGIKTDCDFVARDIKMGDNGVWFTLKGKDMEEDFYINIPGIFSVYNAMAAIIVGYLLKVPINYIKKALQDISGVPGRFEVVDTKTPYRVIIDYAHTPDGLENILKAAKEFSKGRIILVFGCGGDRDKRKRPIMGEIGGRFSDYCIITSDNPRGEEPISIIEDIVPGMDRTDCPYEVIENRREAIKKALIMGQKDDVVIIAGKGHETYQILKDKTIPFDEKTIIKEILDEGENND